MRLAAVPLFYADDPGMAIEKSGESSLTTHGLQVCVDACRYMAGLIVGILQGVDKEEILSERYCPIEGYWDRYPLHPEIDVIAGGSFKHKEPPQISGSGHVVRTLEAALWAFHKTETFHEGCLKVVNLGEDADTTGAVYGQIAGAFYGNIAIPKSWSDKVAKRTLLENIAQKLFAARRTKEAVYKNVYSGGRGVVA